MAGKDQACYRSSQRKGKGHSDTAALQKKGGKGIYWRLVRELGREEKASSFHSLGGKRIIP